MQRSYRWAVEDSVRVDLALRLRAGEMDAKTIILIVVAGVGGLMLLVCVGLVALLLPAVQQARNAARMSQSKNNLKMIGLALHNYHDVYALFPPGGVYAEDGTPHHSWQTMLLPYLELGPVYNALDFNRPWTDPVNAVHFTRPIPAFLNPSVPVQQATGGAASHYAGNKHVLYENSSIKIPDVTDGTANTMLAGEVAAGYRAWADPGNVRDPAIGILNDATSFGNPAGPSNCTILMMDGSVRTISKSVSPAVLKAISTPNGGEPAGAF